MRLPGTEGYAEAADRLAAQWQSVSFEARLGPVLHLLSDRPSRILDIGAGSGEDAAAYAARGHDVVAVEPVDAFRNAAAARHGAPGILWLDDGLPDLARVRGLGRLFDLVALSGVWMHLDGAARRQAMPHVAGLLAPDGRMILSLRHGPVPAGRQMFQVTPQETLSLAAQAGLQEMLNVAAPSVQEDNRRAGVTWTWLAFRRPG